MVCRLLHQFCSVGTHPALLLLDTLILHQSQQPLCQAPADAPARSQMHGFSKAYVQLRTNDATHCTYTTPFLIKTTAFLHSHAYDREHNPNADHRSHNLHEDLAGVLIHRALAVTHVGHILDDHHMIRVLPRAIEDGV